MGERIDKRINPNIAETCAIGGHYVGAHTLHHQRRFFRQCADSDIELKKEDQLLIPKLFQLMHNLVSAILSVQSTISYPITYPLCLIHL
jgi:hypothetical protein